MCLVSDYLARLNAILPQNEEIDVITLDEGFSNKVYQLSWAGKPQLVMRIPGLDASCFHIDRDVEKLVWRDAYARGLTSNICWDDGDGAVVSTFLMGTTFSWDVAHTTETLTLVGAAVAILHRMSRVSYEYDVFVIIDDWLTQIADHDRFDDVALYWRLACQWLQQIDPPIRPHSLALCHNDLIPKNFIVQPQKVWLIDWESAGMNDPLFDLAVLAHSHHLSKQQLESVAAQILSVPMSRVDQRSIEAYRQAYVLRELVWLLLKELTAPGDLNCLEWYHSLQNNPQFNPYFKT
ncbi:hypothetical protein DN730_07570 [Marinomonas piezotolerans]|uniref:Aminoglycoside phosphotransferase domain-containing protein n=1 Tax=Marinomonas piezotolerans TaxID=2213058 RepID=A0A370U8Y4_9GAMM|nr:phosphotransferase [Marinomonas piezotolerans]RDL44259.1 hypothetical protein DN730_07570 [Marinomonas piezotolerans]